MSKHKEKRYRRDSFGRLISRANNSCFERLEVQLDRRWIWGSVDDADHLQVWLGHGMEARPFTAPSPMWARTPIEASANRR